MKNTATHLSPTKWVFLILGIILAAHVLFFALVWPIINQYIPGKHHSGAELFTSDQYLQFEKGEIFNQHLAQLSFVEDAEVLSFDYYDFWFRDAIIKDKPFPDTYLVQLSPEIPFYEIVQYLKTGCATERTHGDGTITTYRFSQDGAEDLCCVTGHHQRQEVYCFLITDYSDNALVGYEDYMILHLGWMPWMDR